MKIQNKKKQTKNHVRDSIVQVHDMVVIHMSQFIQLKLLHLGYYHDDSDFQYSKW